jgi:hypothetical protein
MASMSTRSFGVVLALALGASLASGSARANATFQFTLSGQLDQIYGCPDSSCGSPPDHSYPWAGTLAVVLDSGADGTYDNADMVSFDLASTCCTFHEPTVTPIPFLANFTVAGGKLTSISAVYYDPIVPIVVTTFDGLTVSYYQPLIDFTPPTVGTAVLTPIPEPAAWAMLLFGLALTGLGARLKRTDATRYSNNASTSSLQARVPVDHALFSAAAGSPVRHHPWRFPKSKAACGMSLIRSKALRPSLVQPISSVDAVSASVTSAAT